MQRLTREFYTRDTVTVARELLGCYMMHRVDGQELICRITETEAYAGPEDKACHAYGFKKTERTRSLYLEGGHAYVFLIYGMYHCMNVVSDAKDMPCAVLIRGGEPSGDKDAIALRRYRKRYGELTKAQKKNIANGPGKFCLSMGITKEQDRKSLLTDDLYIYKEETEPSFSIEVSKRINIDYAQEYTDKLWRFYIP